MGIFMGHEGQPVLGHHSPDIDQNCGGLGLQITEAIQAKGRAERRSKDLYGALLPGMKAVLTVLQAKLETGVDGCDLAANPGTDRNTVLRILHQDNQIGIRREGANLIEVGQPCLKGRIGL
jgi:hypothetical protein